jgi:hypothetical protein
MAANRGDTFATALTRIWGIGGVFVSTKVSSPGPGLKPPPKAPSSSSSPPKLNTTHAPSAPQNLPPVSQVASLAVLLKLTLPWVSARA